MKGLGFDFKGIRLISTSCRGLSLKIREEVNTRKKNNPRFYGGAAHGQPVVYWCKGRPEGGGRKQGKAKNVQFLCGAKNSVIIRSYGGEWESLLSGRKVRPGTKKSDSQLVLFVKLTFKLRVDLSESKDPAVGSIYGRGSQLHLTRAELGLEPIHQRPSNPGPGESFVGTGSTRNMF